MYVCIFKIFYLGALRTYFKMRKSLAAKSSGYFMSSDKSAIESDATRSHTDSSDSEKDSKRQQSNQLHEKLIRQKLPWRSEEFEIVLRSLDRKLERCRDPRSKAMCLVVQMGENCLHGNPEGSPDLANNLHHQLLLKLLNFKYTWLQLYLLALYMCLYIIMFWAFSNTCLHCMVLCDLYVVCNCLFTSISSI